MLHLFLMNQNALEWSTFRLLKYVFFSDQVQGMLQTYFALLKCTMILIIVKRSSIVHRYIAHLMY